MNSDEVAVFEQVANIIKCVSTAQKFSRHIEMLQHRIEFPNTSHVHDVFQEPDNPYTSNFYYFLM